MEKRIALIGLGNAGGNIVKRYGQKYPGTAERIIINTSTTDMSKFLPSDYDYSIRMGDLDGTGGNHDVAKNMAMHLMKDKIMTDDNFVDLITDKNYVFVIGSSAGGTGSGMLPVMYQVIKHMDLAEKVIAVCVLPEDGVTVDRLDNTLLNQSELYTDADATYMVYDNSRFEQNNSTFELKKKINEEIVDDLYVFTGIDLLESDYDNMDEEDMLALMSLPGRIVIVRCDDNRQINHTDIESRILTNMDNSAHAILNNDRVVGAFGLIANLSKVSIEGLDNTLPKIRERIGEPTSTYLNLSDQETHTKVIFVMSGLAKPNNRLVELNDLLTEKMSKIRTDEVDFTYKNEQLSIKRRHRRETGDKPSSVSLESIFSKLRS